jgi:hypothetical protein
MQWEMKAFECGDGTFSDEKGGIGESGRKRGEMQGRAGALVDNDDTMMQLLQGGWAQY